MYLSSFLIACRYPLKSMKPKLPESTPIYLDSGGHKWYGYSSKPWLSSQCRSSQSHRTKYPSGLELYCSSKLNDIKITIAKRTNAVHANLIPTQIQNFQSTILGQAFKDESSGLSAKLGPMKIQLLQGVITDQKLLQSRCAEITKIVFGEIQDEKGIYVGEMCENICNGSIVDVVGL